MNYLAHLFLSRDDASLAIGNFIADFITAKQVRMIDDKFKNGIALHRKIDSFTDAHKDFRAGTKRLSEHHGKYAPVVLDILYDHLLAKHWDTFSDISLDTFSINTYDVLKNHIHVFEEFGVHYIQKMIDHNFLMGYREKERVTYVLSKMDQRTRFPSDFASGISHLYDHLDAFEAEFHSFMPEIIDLSKNHSKEAN